MDVLDHIKPVHSRYYGKYAKAESVKDDRKKEIFGELYAQNIGIIRQKNDCFFAAIEEKVDVEQLEAVLDQMIETHNLGSRQISLLENTSVENEIWDARFSLLADVLNNHIEAAEDEFLPMARNMILKLALIEILNSFETVFDASK